MASHADILIVGGGPIGASLALALRHSELRVALIEARATVSDDARTLAISYGTALLLQKLGVSMASLGATAIETIQVSQRGGFGRTSLRASELKLPSLGHVVAYAALSKALEALLPTAGTLLTFGATVARINSTATVAVAEVERDGRPDTMSARLIVLADGGRSHQQVSGIAGAGIAIADRDYRQVALTALVTTDPPAQSTAYERFTPTGPVALLPYRGRYALVWTTSPEEAARLATLETRIFLDRLQQQFTARGMRFVDAGPRLAFPLQLRVARPVTGQRLALVGNAAQALHPVAGQGFNLGMRDVHALAKCISKSDRDSLGGAAMLARYRALRRWDAGGGIAMTDFLVRGFSNDNALVRTGRGLGLAALDLLPPARKWLARKMMFGISG